MHKLVKLHAEAVFRRYDYLCTLSNLAKLINERAAVDQYNPYTPVQCLGMVLAEGYYFKFRPSPYSWHITQGFLC